MIGHIICMHEAPSLIPGTKLPLNSVKWSPDVSLPPSERNSDLQRWTANKKKDTNFAKLFAGKLGLITKPILSILSKISTP